MIAEPSLSDIVPRLEPDSVRVLTFIARRLLLGQGLHGILNVNDPHRDWRRERAEEIADMLVYSACEELKAQQREGG